MPIVKIMKLAIRSHPILAAFVSSFLVWIFAFRGFVFGKLILAGDAVQYSEAVKFYLDNIRQGIYPLWELNRNWGLPCEFFMRRIGEFNPFYYIVLLLDIIGFSHNIAYLLFISFYFFLGIIFFYHLTRLLVGDFRLAFLAALLLLFSSLGTKAFDSFIILLFTPGMGFFYFLLAFDQKQERRSFLGMIFSFMILLITYIPFYFVTLLLLAGLCFAVFYFHRGVQFFKNFGLFARGNKIFVSFCIGILLLSAVPGYLLFLEGKETTSMSIRGAAAPVDNAFAINIKRSHEGGILLYNLPRELFSYLQDFELGVFYLPMAAVLFFLVAFFTPASRKSIFLLVFGSFLFLLGLADGSPIYQYLYRHIFFFKYFRNLHFFLWIAILPVFLILCVLQLKEFLNFSPEKKWQRIGLIAFLVFIHGVLLAYGVLIDTIITTYFVVTLSFLFFLFHFFSKESFVIGKKRFSKEALYLPIFFLLVVLQPLEVYGYLHQNARPFPEGHHYRYQRPDLKLALPSSSRPLTFGEQSQAQDKAIFKNPPQVWFNTRWGDALRQSGAYRHYLRRSKILLYDNIEWLEDDKIDWKKVDKTLSEGVNVAYVAAPSREDKEESKIDLRNPFVNVVTSDSDQVKIFEFGNNFVKFSTNLNTKKFLVYNDSYHPKWHATIDGRSVDLYRANIAFKGLWIPEGEHMVEMHFGSPGQYFFKYLMIAIFLGTFLYLLFLYKNIFQLKRS